MKLKVDFKTDKSLADIGYQRENKKREREKKRDSNN